MEWRAASVTQRSCFAIEVTPRAASCARHIGRGALTPDANNHCWLFKLQAQSRCVVRISSSCHSVHALRFVLSAPHSSQLLANAFDAPAHNAVPCLLSSETTIMRLLHVVCLHLLFPCFLCFESLILAQGELRKDRPVRPLHFAAPDWNLYHRTNRLFKVLLDTAQSCQTHTVTPFVIDAGESLTPEQPPKSVTVTTDSHLPLSGADGLLYFTVRSRSSARFSLRAKSSSKTRSVFVFGEEGRDLLTSEISLRVLSRLCTNDTSPLSLPSHAELIVVPVANPDGRTIAEMGRRCDRTNANDVELDRNWASFWRFEEDSQQNTTKTKVSAIRAAVSRRFSRADATVDEIASPISGTHPFSEPESRALRNLVFLLHPTSYVSVRTGAPAITVPWDCKDQQLPNSQITRLSQVMKSVNAAHCNRCKSGSLRNVTGAVKCGTSTDYMYGTMRVPFVYSWHVYDAEAPQGDCFRKHNPVSQAAYERITNNWAGAVLNFSLAVHNWMTLETEHGIDVAQQNASLAAAEATIWRAEAIAKGMPDPESSMLDDAVGNVERNAASLKKQITDANKRKGGHGENDKIATIAITDNHVSLLQEDESKNAKLAENKVSDTDDEEYHFRFLTGWAGAWASLCILGLGLFIAKRYFFGDRRKRYRYRSRGPRLPGKRA